jgi:hypothetical protein
MQPDGRHQLWSLSSEIAERLHCERLDDAAFVIQVGHQDAQNALPFECTPSNPRKHLGDVPTHFFLIAIRKRTDGAGTRDLVR